MYTDLPRLGRTWPAQKTGVEEFTPYLTTSRLKRRCHKRITIGLNGHMQLEGDPTLMEKHGSRRSHHYMTPAIERKSGCLHAFHGDLRTVHDFHPSEVVKQTSFQWCSSRQLCSDTLSLLSDDPQQPNYFPQGGVSPQFESIFGSEEGEWVLH